jgi:hypothetical protein
VPSADVTTAADMVSVRDRIVPVDDPLGSVLPDGGLRRGWIVGCDGPAAVSSACALVAAATRAGSWLLVLGVPSLDPEALAGFGVPLHRVVSVDAGGSASTWADRLAAAADGFELVLTTPPRRADGVERRIRQRLQARGVVVVSLGGSTLGCDVVLDTGSPRWTGIGAGHGRLAARSVDVTVSGRRAVRPARCSVWLPASHGRMHPVGDLR